MEPADLKREGITPIPEHKHDCNSCRFLGHKNGMDIYFCTQGGRWPTFIARTSSEPSHNYSGANFVMSGEFYHSGGAVQRAQIERVSNLALTDDARKAITEIIEEEEPSWVNTVASVLATFVVQNHLLERRTIPPLAAHDVGLLQEFVEEGPFEQAGERSAIVRLLAELSRLVGVEAEYNALRAGAPEQPDKLWDELDPAHKALLMALHTAERVHADQATWEACAWKGLVDLRTRQFTPLGRMVAQRHFKPWPVDSTEHAPIGG